MTDIELLIEAQGARRLPCFWIEINGKRYPHDQIILHVDGHRRHLECRLRAELSESNNSLCVIMDDKQDQDNIDPATGDYVDHHISIKQVRVDDIDADALLYKQSYVEHAMPTEWVENMRQLGHEILSRYPGSDMHLNGRMTFEFKMPFWLEKTLCIDSSVPKKY